jgi:hypothetical protein
MEPINSMFDLYNRKETGLSRSLAAIIYSDDRVLWKILKDNNLKFNSVDRKTLKVYYELTNEKDRFDIFCDSENFAIIVETKVGDSNVSNEQREKYIEKLKKYDKKYKILVQITQFNNQEVVNNKDVTIINVLWMKILEIIKNYKITINVSHEFENYIVRSHNMRITDGDIWAVVVKDLELKRLREEHIYIKTEHHDPIFIGFRLKDKDLNKVVVKELYPVLDIWPSDDPQSLRKYGDLSKIGNWVYVLGDPIILKNPMKNFPRQPAIMINFADLNKYIST